jgi:uncharacterized membrane protein YkvA (DUF1232 family)
MGGFMLKALSQQLRDLADNSFDEFRETIKNRMGGKVTDEQVTTLKEFIFLLPTTINVLNSYWNDKATPPDAKKLSGLVLSYTLKPNDFLPLENYGLFGYLDDAFIVVSAFLHIQDLYLRDWHDKSSEEIELTKRARDLIVAPDIIIPEEATRMREFIGMYLNGEVNSVEEYMSR